MINALYVFDENHDYTTIDPAKNASRLLYPTTNQLFNNEQQRSGYR